MKTFAARRTAAFTLLEMMLAISILAVVLTAVYSSWMSILRADKVAKAATATMQRQRMAMQIVKEALTSAQLFVANIGYYGFTNSASMGSGSSSLSFVARLPAAFPRSGKFGDFNVRRVSFSVETDADRHTMLCLRQNPILMDMDQDEVVHPVVLARDVKLFKAEFWDPTVNDWTDDWQQTNSLPQLVRVSFQLNYGDGPNAVAGDLITRVYGIPTVGVAAVWQVTAPGRGTTTGGGGVGAGAGRLPGSQGATGGQGGASGGGGINSVGGGIGGSGGAGGAFGGGNGGGIRPRTQ